MEKTDDVMKQYNDYEIICVNDGSKDNTLQELKELKKDFPSLKIVSYNDNVGMGHAIKKGIEVAGGDVIITLDADQTFDPGDIPKLISHIDEYDIVIGSPYTSGGKLEEVSFYRV
ncbi:MAG: glycosyltransferase family 2 protein [Candidatus Methanofastidiosia archaeon]